VPQVIHNELKTFLNRQFPEQWLRQGWSTSYSLRSSNLTPNSVGFCDRWGLYYANAYIPEKLENQISKTTATTNQTLLQNIWQKAKNKLVCAGNE
jgi:hypothetical protein